MPKKLNPERRKLVALCAGMAAASGAILPFLHAHHTFAVVWMTLEAGAVGYAVWKMIELRRSGHRCS